VATELVDKAIAAHGGIEPYRSADEIVIRIASGGAAFAMRFKHGALRSFEGRVSTSEPRTVISPYPRDGHRGVFDRGSVRIESDDGTVVAERKDPRAAFRSLRRNLWWDDLDLLYFAGYALWGYMATPFLFLRPGFELEEEEPWVENGERWERLKVQFPPDVPNHSREQVFYFDDAGLLRRLDYTAEVFGSWAKAAHLCHDHREFDGLVLPTRRRVFPRRRNNRPGPFPTLVWIDVEDVRLV
jgi:hypothetical protein